MALAIVRRSLCTGGHAGSRLPGPAVGTEAAAQTSRLNGRSRDARPGAGSSAEPATGARRSRARPEGCTEASGAKKSSQALLYLNHAIALPSPASAKASNEAEPLPQRMQASMAAARLPKTGQRSENGSAVRSLIVFLDPEDDRVPLNTLMRAASAVGMRVEIGLR